MNRKDLDKIAQPIVDIFLELEQELLMNIAILLEGKKDLLRTDPETWRLLLLESLGLLDKNNLQSLKKLLGVTSAELNNLILNIGLDGLKATDKEMKDLIKKGARLVTPPEPLNSPNIISLLKAYEDQAINILNLTNQTMLNNAKKVYIDIINKTVMELSMGSVTHDQALRRTISQYAEKGIPALIDRSGRQWGVEGYIRTVLTSTTNNVVNQLQDTRFDEWGIDLIEVSSHAGNRPGCRPYAGRIFSLKPNHPKYPYLYDPAIGRIGDPDSLFGINCGHYKYAFVDGISEQRFFPPESEKEDQKIYDQSQKQRAIERSIRKAKTRLEMFKALDDEIGIKNAQALVRNRQATMRAFINETGRTRRNYREQIIK